VDIGVGRKIASIVAKRLARLMAERGEKRPDAVTLSMRHFGAAEEQLPPQGHVVIDGSEGASIQLASCCHPIPGDEIVGYLGRGEGLTVHSADCGVGRRLYERDSERWLPVEWSEQPVRAFEAEVNVLVSNGKGVLARVAAAVSATETDITHIDMGAERAAETTELKLTLAVRDRQHLADALRTLRRAPSVMKVARVRG
jgi:GTP diphosphokinase / guanosine-3',5'-bis(diphosphate) 3'-diphosphatase